MTQTRKDFIWNTIGSTLYALSSFVLAMAVIRMCGPERGGIFTFGFSTLGQQLFIVAYFGVRPFHITDIDRNYSFPVYRQLRRITSAAAILISAAASAVILLGGMGSPEKAMLLPLIVFYKIADGYADVYESECQRVGKLYIGGFALAARTAAAAAVLLGVLAVSGSLTAAVVAADLTQLIAILYYRSYCRKHVFVDTACQRKQIAADTAGQRNQIAADTACQRKQIAADTTGQRNQAAAQGTVPALAQETGFLFLAAFLDFFIFSASRYAVDLILGSSASSVSGILYMPASVIYLAANFFIRPYLTRLAEAYADGKRAETVRIRRRISGLIWILTALALAAVFLIGRPMLSLLEMLLGGRLEGALLASFLPLVLIIAGGGIYAAANLEYYLLVILKQQKRIFYIYAGGSLLALAVIIPMVKKFGMTGGAAAFAVYMTALYLAFGLLRRHAERAVKESR